MAKTVEEILGPIARELPIPGTYPQNPDKVRYVSFDRNKQPADVYAAVVRRISPPLIKQGAAILNNFILTTPDGIAFYALTYHGDPAWQRQIELGAVDLGLLTAKIADGSNFVISNGLTYPLADCTVEKVTPPPKRKRRGSHS